MALIEVLERVFERPPAAFGRVAFAPGVTRERPADLKPRPPFGIQKSDPANHPAAGFLLDSPVTVTAHLPVPHEERDASPRVGARVRRLTRLQVPHDERISGEFRVVIEIALTPSGRALLTDAPTTIQMQLITGLSHMSADEQG